MRNTRSNAAAAAKAPREARDSPAKPQMSIEQETVSQRYPLARRNPPFEAAQRGSSISTNPARPDDETEFIDDDDEYFQRDEPGSQPKEVEISSEHSRLSPELDPEKLKNLKILEPLVPDLARAADSLYKFSKQKSLDKESFQGTLGVKRHAFDSMQNSFKRLGQPYKGDFVEITSFMGLGSTQQQRSLVGQIARVNTVIAYDRINNIGDDQAPEIFKFLKTFNEAFPDYFLLAPEMFQEPEVILDMRTWLLVEALSGTDGQSNIEEALVEIFCDPYKIGNLASVEEQSNYPALLSGHYFREVGDSGHVDTEELCSTRILEIIEVFKKKGKRDAISHLLEKYPLRELLRNLSDCFDAMYNISADEESVPVDTHPPYPDHQATVESVPVGTQSPYSDQQPIVESQSDPFGSDSQSIIRAETQDAEPTLFVDKRSLLALERGTQRDGTLPPPNQQLAGPKSIPHDYHQHANADLLGSPFPPASSFRVVSNSDRSQYQGHKRPRSVTTEDDDEDDPFETDDRRVNPARRAELKRQMPPPPRPESISRSLPRRVPVPSSARSVPPAFDQESLWDSTSQEDLRPPSSSVVNYDALKKAASQRNREARLADPGRQGPRQRVPWSDHDTQLLLDYIQEHGARWSMIESECKHYFEYPRNQQAYRDRARNLKTELLITDAVLPPNFNDVVLGSKEIIRVKAVGKNPDRREEDVDADGDPINTELPESTSF
ncbi:hypothetical protein FG05_13312 [Fusarium graminearum]|nr:hypothetical protein FG05_13312 [Fusarium graminearum]